MLTAGSLFSGVGGLSLAVEQAFGARTAWVSDIDKAANAVLARRFPGVPNLGDITAIDWSTVEPVDIIEGGSPCQDVSTAGQRKGMADGTRSNLWVVMREAIATIRPHFVVWENVGGSLSATASSREDDHGEICGPECDPGCLGDGSGGPNLRALGRVLGDLASLGYDTQWRGVRASDVGACHQRLRVFVLAWDSDRVDPQGHGAGWLPVASTPVGAGLPVGADREPGLTLPTPVADHSRGLPQPQTDVQSLPNEVMHRWGDYASAIARHEQMFGRPAPEPTIPTKRGGRKLSGEFTEWMMGLPAGWIWDLVQDGTITNNDALKLCGNGVVPQQAAYALRLMLPAIQAVAA